jgi:hypothetical protein
MGCKQFMYSRSRAATEIQALLTGAEPFQHGPAQTGEKPLIPRICRIIGMKIILGLFSLPAQKKLTGHKDKAAIRA